MGVFIFILGLIIGSFISAFTYRFPRGKSISHGRSECTNCKKTIRWYDNIPMLSYLFLRGKCRHCDKKISPRYPFIEIFTAFVFVIFYIYRSQIHENLPWIPDDGIFQLTILGFIAFIVISIFIIDAEHQIIPDLLLYALWGVTIALMVLGGFSNIYHHISAGFLSALFLLLINLVTRGKGMGLGDVKLAIAFGTALGPVISVLWIFMGFIFGGVVATFLLLFGKAGMKDKVAFGPFLVLSFIVCVLFGQQLAEYFLPYII